MKAQDKMKDIRRVAYRLPDDLCEKLEKIAILNHRSINDELISILNDYFNMPIAWENHVVEKVKSIALEGGYTVSFAVNFVISKYLEELQEIQENPKKAAV